MNDEMFPNDKSQILGPGKLLRLAREEKNLRPEDVAYEIRLTQSQVLALDEDDYSKMPEETYVRGYLRNYARLVGVAENDILMAFARITRSSEAAKAASKLQPENSNLAGNIAAGNGIIKGSSKGVINGVNSSSRKGGSKMLLLATASIVLVGAIGAFFWVQEYSEDEMQLVEKIPGPDVETSSNSDLDSVIDEVPVGVSTLKLDELKVVENATSASKQNDKVVDVSEAPNSSVMGDALEAEPKNSETGTAITKMAGANAQLSTEATRQPETGSAPVTRVESVAPVSDIQAPALDGGVLLLHYSKDSWTDVRDANGKKLLYRTVKAGEKVALAGKLPMSLFFGFAQGVSVKFNGISIDVDSYTRGVFARFTVGEAVSQ